MSESQPAPPAPLTVRHFDVELQLQQRVDLRGRAAHRTRPQRARHPSHRPLDAVLVVHMSARRGRQSEAQLLEADRTVRHLAQPVLALQRIPFHHAFIKIIKFKTPPPQPRRASSPFLFSPSAPPPPLLISISLIKWPTPDINT